MSGRNPAALHFSHTCRQNTYKKKAFDIISCHVSRWVTQQCTGINSSPASLEGTLGAHCEGGGGLGGEWITAGLSVYGEGGSVAATWLRNGIFLSCLCCRSRTHTPTPPHTHSHTPTDRHARKQTDPTPNKQVSLNKAEHISCLNSER